MTHLTFDTAQCLLMAKVSARMRESARYAFWQLLPDIIPDWDTYLPTLISGVRDETKWYMLDTLSLSPLPTTFSPETAKWRPGLVAAWEKHLKESHDAFDEKKDLVSISRYIFSFRGLIQVDRCGMPPGATCLSGLPTLLNGARYACEKFTGSQQLGSKRLEYLATLAGWRPAPNVITDPDVLNGWADFWLELYQQGDRHIGEEEPNDLIILKGIAAKALLNLVESDGKEVTRLSEDMKSLLLESLVQSIDVVGTKKPLHNDTCKLGWLSWQPQDATRFHLDTLAELPKSLLKKLSLSCENLCQISYSRQLGDEMQRVTQPLLTEIVRWDRAGLLAACGIDLLPHVVSELNDLLKRTYHFQSQDLLSHELCRWLVREEVANVEGGIKLLQKFERHWQYECVIDHCELEDPRSVAWYGRMQLQRAGLSIETDSDFHKNLLKAIKKEKFGEVGWVLSLWRPEKDTRGRESRELESLWKKKLESHNEQISLTAALALLRPDVTGDFIGQRQKLLNILTALPEKVRPQLSIAEVTHLMGDLPPGSPNVAPGAALNGTWQFGPNETRFRVLTEPAVPISTPPTIQPACPDSRPDRMVQRIVGSEPQSGRL